MNRHANHADQVVLALALTARVSDNRPLSHSVENRAGCLPFIGAGTFLVAAYLGSSVGPNSSADKD
jgi:hypothetical protein